MLSHWVGLSRVCRPIGPIGGSSLVFDWLNRVSKPDWSGSKRLFRTIILFLQVSEVFESPPSFLKTSKRFIFFDKSFNPGVACGLGRLRVMRWATRGWGGEFPAFKPASELFIAAVWQPLSWPKRARQWTPPTRLIRVDKSQYKGEVTTLHLLRRSLKQLLNTQQGLLLVVGC